MRLIAGILALLLVPFAGAQTTAPKSITTANPPKAKPFVITMQQKGNQVAVQLLPENIPQLPINVPPLTLVFPATQTYDVTCTYPSDSEVITNPDGSRTVTHVKCTFTPEVTP